MIYPDTVFGLLASVYYLTLFLYTHARPAPSYPRLTNQVRVTLLLGLISHLFVSFQSLTVGTSYTFLRISGVCRATFEAWLYGVTAYIVLGLDPSCRKWHRILTYWFPGLLVVFAVIRSISAHLEWRRYIKQDNAYWGSAPLAVGMRAAENALYRVNTVLYSPVQWVRVGTVAVLTWELCKGRGGKHAAAAGIARIVLPAIVLSAGREVLRALAYEFPGLWVVSDALAVLIELLPVWGVCRAIQAARKEEYGNGDESGEMGREKARIYYDEEWGARGEDCV